MGQAGRHEGLAKSDPREVGLQVSRCDRTQIPSACVFLQTEKGGWYSPSRVVPTKKTGLEKANVQPDHIHMLFSIPPKHSVAHTIEFLKGQSAVRILRELLRTRGTLFGPSLWSRGYCVSTVGLDEAMIPQYIRNQEEHQRDQERELFDKQNKPQPNSPFSNAFLKLPALPVVLNVEFWFSDVDNS